VAFLDVLKCREKVDVFKGYICCLAMAIAEYFITFCEFIVQAQNSRQGS
jgi:hypothetical protein